MDTAADMTISIPDHAIIRLRQRLSHLDLLTTEPDDEKLRALLDVWLSKAARGEPPRIVLSEGRAVAVLELQKVSGRPLVAVVGRNLVPKGRGQGKSHVLLTLLDPAMAKTNLTNGMWQELKLGASDDEFVQMHSLATDLPLPGARTSLEGGLVPHGHRAH
jgi:hypothetical protein